MLFLVKSRHFNNITKGYQEKSSLFKDKKGLKELNLNGNIIPQNSFLNKQNNQEEQKEIKYYPKYDYQDEIEYNNINDLNTLSKKWKIKK